MFIGHGESQEGPRLGGRAPEGVSPALKGARFFVTLPLTQSGDREFSVFISFDFDEMAEASRKLQADGNGLIDVVVHDRSRRSDSDELLSELSAHPIGIGGESPDWIVADGGKIIESGHKIGGRPYFDQPRAAMLQAVDALTSQGFIQFVQIGFPSGANDADVSGDWPFADGMFHLFARMNGEDLDWRCLWDF
jgi:hypothetical protein